MITPTPFTPEAPPTTGLDLWLVDTAAHAAWASALGDSVLSTAERARAAGFHREDDRRDYVVSHVALRVVLGARTGVRPAAVAFTRAACPGCGGPHGRPELADGAAEFSLSHARGAALVAVAAGVVGADVELLPAADVLADLTTALHPREQQELALLPTEGRPAAFTRAWSRKESYLKALGTGLSRDPAADYLGTGPAPAALPGWTVADVAVPEGYRAAVTVRAAAGA
ncbi:4'-phosphopantetheinyl transferase family protein [Streptacidiphilus monticola]|uniref:4'-phosphopantetheinyl transferase family protein n=1 Tax=Streptacidiphilus monticola TaxID=2161674 RepID=A0ABW1G3G8_9ACTN